jgi:hypothetical protein
MFDVQLPLPFLVSLKDVEARLGIRQVLLALGLLSLFCQDHMVSHMKPLTRQLSGKATAARTFTNFAFLGRLQAILVAILGILIIFLLD